MAITINSIKCPECGASLPVVEGRSHMFCTYCGTSIMLTNENEHIYRTINEAKVKQAEMDQAVQMKKLEIIERKRAEAAKVKKIKMIIYIIMGAVGIALMIMPSYRLVGLLILIGILILWTMDHNNKEEDDLDFGDKVRVPSSISDFESRSYASIEAILTSVGFTNIRCLPLNDLTTGLLKKPGMVESITINGKEITSGGGNFV